jgi:hypothetical protein
VSLPAPAGNRRGADSGPLGFGSGPHVGSGLSLGWSVPGRGTLTLGAGGIRCWEGAARPEAAWD